MLLLRSALESIAIALETSGSPSALITELERALGVACHPARITLALSGDPSAASGTAIPLRLDGTVIGNILVEGPRDPLAPLVMDALRLLAAPIAAAIAYRQRPERRNRDGQSANIDALCRIPNRRAFDEHLSDAWERALAHATPLVIALVDVDFFKLYNDRYGHVAGDRCLQQVASLLIKRRDGDDGFAARYGGEEFVIVFELSTLDRAVGGVQQIIDRLAALQIEHAGTTLGRVSISVGIAATIPTLQRTKVELVEEADRALYSAKRFGRNRICAGSYVSKAPVVAKLRSRGRTFATADVPSFGRDEDLARLLAALRHARMLTLVGPTGIGKSRLLALLADEAASRLRRPVVFVEPELLRAEMDPATAVASACDLSLDAGGVLDTLTDFLADREAVVILDDVEGARADIKSLCEHLIAHASGVSIIAAARMQLGIASERTIVVPPLNDDAALELLASCGGGDDAASRRIVRLLGGNPASIQAAGEWIARRGATEVLERLATLDGACPDPAELGALFAASIAEAAAIQPIPDRH
jgi:diguanylate cyclase (GGDEF)-like protein